MSAAGADVAANFAGIAERIEAAARRAGRLAREITLVGVTKTFPAENLRAAYACGVRHFGENRVQEWEKKEPLVKDLDATWHLIGHLQSNKAARGVRLFHAVDSVDSLAIAQKLESALTDTAAGDKATRRLRVLIEVRVAEEESKSGASESDVVTIAQGILGLAHLELRGLMCIPPYFEDREEARPFFRRLRLLRDNLAGQIARELPVLSMGMSHDFEVAVEEGATEVRVGSALFGPRKA